MDIHVCKQCGSRFMYCRKCVFRPVRYKDAGFCSKECYEASKSVVIPVVESDVIEDVVVVEELKQIDDVVEDVKSIDAEMSVEVEAETAVLAETPSSETIAVAEPTIKKETNVYKKKKSKH